LDGSSQNQKEGQRTPLNKNLVKTQQIFKGKLLIIMKVKEKKDNMLKRENNSYEQSGGEGSTNIQGEVVNYHGLQYSDVRQIAMDVFNANFYELSEEASRTAQERTQEIIDIYIEKLKTAGEEVLEQVNDPDVQYALFNAQMGYARRGDKDLAEMLTELLVERTKTNEVSLKQIVLNEAIEIAPKLSSEQINLLTLLFVLKDVSFRSATSLSELQFVLEHYISNFIPTNVPSINQLLHLEYCGCLNIERVASTDLTVPITSNYTGLFQKGFSYEEFISNFSDFDDNIRKELLINNLHDQTMFQINALSPRDLEELENKNLSPNQVIQVVKFFRDNVMDSDQIKSKITDIFPSFSKLNSIWEHSDLKSATLSTVGKAIAHSNLKKVTGITADLEIWMK
jgi:hypothetical protein